MTETDYMNFLLPKNTHFEKEIQLLFFNISENLQENQSPKVLAWKNSFKEWF